LSMQPWLRCKVQAKRLLTNIILDASCNPFILGMRY
jgi:hypothetical protein